MEPRSQQIAAALKLGSALCALAATSLLALPLVRGETGAFALPPGLPGLAVPSAEAPAGESSDAPVQESRAAFKGALLSLESSPSGASVRVDGADQGETPVTVGLDCAPNTPVVVTFSLSGFASATHRLACPRNTLVTVKARLHPGARGAAGKR